MLGPKIIQKLEAELQPWLEERIPITAEMIADMTQLLGNVDDLFDTAKTAAEELDKRVRELQAARDESARLARDAEEEAARRAQAEAEAKRIVEEDAARIRQQALDQLRTEQEKERQRNLEVENRRLAADAQQRRHQQLESNLKTTKVASDVAYGAIRHLNSNWLPGSGIHSLLADAQFHFNKLANCQWHAGDFGKRTALFDFAGRQRTARLEQSHDDQNLFHRSQREFFLPNPV